MSSTSPYSNNDYNTLNYRGYTLPINDIYKAVVAQNKYWDEGAARVKSYYDNVLNLSLTSEENKQIRDKFIQDSEKQLTKLSSMDLSDLSVQRQGFNIFKPITKDKDIMYDNYLTEQIKNIYSDAESYKNDEKTKGSGYNIDNLEYALTPFSEFNKDTKRGDIEKIYNKAKNSEYIPYYDFSKERLDILKNCKPDRFSNTTQQGMYLETYTDESLTQEKLRGCLSNLSGQALQQIRISGSVAYKHDYNALKQDYLDNAKESVKYYTDKISKLSAQKAAARGNEELQSQIQENIDQYDEQLSTSQQDVNTIGTWDDKYVSDRYEQLAATAYNRRVNLPFAQAFARLDIERNKKADPVSMMTYTQQKLDDRLDRSITANKELALLKARMNILSGGSNLPIDALVKAWKELGGDPSQLQRVFGSASDEEGPDYSKFNDLIDDNNKLLTSTFSDIKTVLEADPDLSKVISGVTTPEQLIPKLNQLQIYISSQLKKDPNALTSEGAKAKELMEALNKFTLLNNKNIVLNATLNDAMEEVDKKNGTLRQNKEGIRKGLIEYVNYIKSTITDTNGNVWNPNKIFNIVDGSDPDYKLYITDIPTTNITGQFSISDLNNIKSINFKNKKTGETVEFQGKNIQIIRKLLSQFHKKENDYNAAVSDLLNKKLAVQRPTIISGDLLDPKNGSPDVKRAIQSIFGSNPGLEFHTVGNVDMTEGWVEIQAFNKNNKDKPLSMKELENLAAKSKGQFEQSMFREGSTSDRLGVKLDVLKLTPIADGLRDFEHLITLSEKDVKNNQIPTGGIFLDYGYTPQGKKLQLKISKNIGNGQPKYTVILSDGINPNSEIQTSSKEDALNTLLKASQR